MQWRKNMRRHFILLSQLVLLLSLAMLTWVYLHRPQTVPPDIYPYLTSLSPDLIIKYQENGRAISRLTWIDLLAITSSIPEDQAQNLIAQLYAGQDFEHLDWGQLERSKVAAVQRRREILQQYPIYTPGQYDFPVLGETWYMDTFGAERSGGQRTHEGIDLFGQEGTPIVNVTPGYVEKLGWNRLGGERVGVRGDDGNYYYYAHLQTIEPSLYIGKRVERGENIGQMGHTGDAIGTPDHLHFGIELPDNTWINSYSFLKLWQHYQSE